MSNLNVKTPTPRPQAPVPKDRAPQGVPTPGRPVQRAAPAATAAPLRAPAPAPRAPTPAPRAQAPAPRAQAPAPRAAAPVPEAPRRRGAPTRAEREAKLAAAQVEDEAPLQEEGEPGEEIEIEEGREGDEGLTEAEDFAEEQPEATEPQEEPAAEEEVLEPEVEDVPAPAPRAPKAAAPLIAQRNPNPTPAVRKPAAPAPKAPTTAVEHRAATGNGRPGKELAQRHSGNVQPAARQEKANQTLKGDILIPRILLMQGSSQLVKDRKAAVGDIVRSTNGARLGGSNGPGKPADPVKIIPLSLGQSWTIMSGDGKTFIRSEPRTAENDSDPWEFEDGGESFRRLKTVDAIVLLEDDLERSASGAVEVDEEGFALDLDAAVVTPYAVSFKSTGFQAGKSISTHFARVDAQRKVHPLTRPFHYGLQLSCSVESDDSGNEWYVFEAGHAFLTPKHLRAPAESWYQSITKGDYQIEDEGLAEAALNTEDEQPAPAAPKTQRRQQF